MNKEKIPNRKPDSYTFECICGNIFDSAEHNEIDLPICFICDREMLITEEFWWVKKESQK